MRPLGFLTGIVLGSSAAISLVLLMVVLTLVVAAAPEVGREYPALVGTAGLFAALAALSGAAFVGLQRERPWRWAAQVAMWLLMAGIALYFWPTGG